MASLASTGWTGRSEIEGAQFGAGRDRPYERALLTGAADVVLHGSPSGPRRLEMSRFTRPADDVDHRVLLGIRGPVLDVGCGPGRMVAAAIAHRLPVLGIDVSEAAIGLAVQQGLPVLRRSVVERLPLEGLWSSVLLLDGNVGIGGSPLALLARCMDLVRPGGQVVVEVDAEPGLRDRFTAVLVGDAGDRSAPFAWAEIGREGLLEIAEDLGLIEVASWVDSGRAFVILRSDDRPRGPAPAHADHEERPSDGPPPMAADPVSRASTVVSAVRSGSVSRST